MINYLLIGMTLAGIAMVSLFTNGVGNTVTLLADEIPAVEQPPSAKPIRGWIDLQGNRGARGNRPENTLPSFIHGAKQNMSTLTVNANLTKDNHFILHHTPWIDEDLCLDEMGEPAEETDIIEMTLDDLKKLDCGSLIHDDFPDQLPAVGSKLLTLEELFDYFNDASLTTEEGANINFNIQMVLPDDYTDKDIETIATLLVGVIKTANMVERTSVGSFELKLLPIIKHLEKRIITAAMFSPSSFQALRLMIGLDANRPDIVSDTLAAGADIISPQYLYVNEEFVQFCHDQNLMVFSWLANEEDTMIELFSAGVDGVISDYPALLYQTYTDWRKESPHE